MNSGSTIKPIQQPDFHAGLRKLLRRQGRRYRRQLRLCQSDFSEAAVHDLRVSIRRLLSTVEMLACLLPPRRIKKARRALKAQLVAFAELRDTQVQLLRLARLRSNDTTLRAFGDYLQDRERKFVQRARKQVNRMKPGKVESLIADFEADLSVRRAARLGRLDAALLLRAASDAFVNVRTLQAAINPSDTDSIHRTRVAFKRFRYCMESLEPLLGSALGSRIRGLRAYQNRMGRIQDATVLLQSAERFARTRLRAESAAPLLRRFQRAQKRLISLFMKHAGQLDQFKPPPARPARLRRRQPAEPPVGS